MKRIFGVLLIITLLCFFGMTAVSASEGMPNEMSYPVTPLYTIKGRDARGFKFEIRLVTCKVFYVPNTQAGISEAEQILKNETDGDLRFMNEVTKFGIENVGFGSFYDRVADDLHESFWEDRPVTTLQIFDSKNEKIRIYVMGISEELYEYPKEGKQTLLAYLLDAGTTVEAVAKLQSLIGEDGSLTAEMCDLLKTELEKEYSSLAVEPLPAAPTPAWILPTAICGGAVVLACAATATAVFIRRKKRGAAVADAPAEEENA